MTNLYDSYWQSKRNCSDPMADTTSNQTLSQLALNWTISVETSKLTPSLFFELPTNKSGLSIESSALRLKQLLPQVDSFSVCGTLHLSRSHKALVWFEENLKFNFEKLFTQGTGLLRRESYSISKLCKNVGTFLFLLHAVQGELLLFNNLHNSSCAPNGCLEYYKVKQLAL